MQCNVIWDYQGWIKEGTLVTYTQWRGVWC